MIARFAVYTGHQGPPVVVVSRDGGKTWDSFCQPYDGTNYEARLAACHELADVLTAHAETREVEAFSAGLEALQPPEDGAR